MQMLQRDLGQHFTLCLQTSGEWKDRQSCPVLGNSLTDNAATFESSSMQKESTCEQKLTPEPVNKSAFVL